MADIPSTSESQEWTPENLKSQIDSTGKNVVDSFRESWKQRGKEMSDKEIREYDCRIINGNILTSLMNEQGIPGMIFTLEPIERHHFKDYDKIWNFHSVGVLQIGDDKYAAFDQTNRQTRGDESQPYFLSIGNLDEVSGALNERFGFDWNLSFVPKNKPENSVLAKINNSKQMIVNHVKADYQKHVTFQPSVVGGMIEERPLGLKFSPDNNRPMSDIKRSVLTLPYA